MQRLYNRAITLTVSMMRSVITYAAYNVATIKTSEWILPPDSETLNLISREQRENTIR